MLVSQAGGIRVLPRPMRLFFQWFGRISNLFLALYCVLVGIYALAGLARGGLEAHEMAFQVLVAVLMGALAFSFWRSSRAAH